MEERLSIAICFKPFVPSLRIVGAAREAREARESAALTLHDESILHASLYQFFMNFRARWRGDNGGGGEGGVGGKIVP